MNRTCLRRDSRCRTLPFFKTRRFKTDALSRVKRENAERRCQQSADRYRNAQMIVIEVPTKVPAAAHDKWREPAFSSRDRSFSLFFFAETFAERDGSIFFGKVRIERSFSAEFLGYFGNDLIDDFLILLGDLAAGGASREVCFELVSLRFGQVAARGERAQFTELFVAPRARTHVLVPTFLSLGPTVARL